MPGPFAENCIGVKIETDSPMELLQFEPSHLPRDRWLHRRDELGEDTPRSTVVDQYALPDSDSYSVRLVTVPAGETLQMGTLGRRSGRGGGADLLLLTSRESIPADWVEGTVEFGEFP